MDAEEIARLIAELETRVERLRAMYEQYFMGIERIEPLTMRKDVDRRLWALRREQIRNTGLRFKLETTIQRYNTYQQYWQRIVREIEAGTYQRDFGRAAQRFGEAVTAFGKRRQRMFEKGLGKKAERDARRTGAGDSSEASLPEVEEAADPASETFDVTFDDDAAPASTRRDAAEPAEPLELEMRDGLSSESPSMPAEGQRAPPPIPAAPRPASPGVPAAGVPRPAAAGAPPVPSPRAPFASSAGQGAPPPPPPRAPLASSSGQAAPPPAARAPMASSAGLGAPPPHGAPPVPPPRAPLASSSGQGVPLPPARPMMASVSGLEKQRVPIGPVAVAPAKPVIPAATPTRPSPTAPTQIAAAPGAAARPAPTPAATAAKPPTPAASPAPARPALGAPPVVRPAAAAPKPASTIVEKPPPPRAPAPSVSDAHKPPAVLSEDNNLSPIRMREIYGQFVEAKRKANESTASVTYEKIAANLESAAKELRAKHNARSVDFEVVMKNGKPVLKPVVKG